MCILSRGWGLLSDSGGYDAFWRMWITGLAASPPDRGPELLDMCYSVGRPLAAAPTSEAVIRHVSLFRGR
jgi:hypothetical protein